MIFTLCVSDVPSPVGRDGFQHLKDTGMERDS